MVISRGICSREETFGSVSLAGADDCDANNMDVTTAGRQHESSLHRHRLMTHLLHLFEGRLEGKAATKALYSLDENTKAIAIRTTARDLRACALMLILLQRLSRLVGPAARRS